MVVGLDMSGTLIYLTLKRGYTIDMPVALSQELCSMQKLVSGVRKQADSPAKTKAMICGIFNRDYLVDQHYHTICPILKYDLSVCIWVSGRIKTVSSGCMLSWSVNQ